ncbi:hypothetical protein Tco_0786793 [Tanacetum coccineum]
MRTRSQTRNRNHQQQSQPAVVQPFHLEEPFVNPPLVPMADNRTMAQLLQAPTEEYEDAIVIPEINANFELKHGLINLMPRECLRIIETRSKVRNSRNKAVVAKVSSNSSTPGISPDVVALTTEVSELKNMMKTMLIDKQKPKLPHPREKIKPSLISRKQEGFMKLFKQLRLEIGLRDALIEMPKFNKWLSTLLRNKEKLEEIAITTVNAECSAIILNKVLKKLEDLGKFLIPLGLQELVRTNGFSDSGDSINSFAPSLYYKQLWLMSETRNPSFQIPWAVLLNTPLSDKVECSDPDVDIDEIDAFLAMEVSSNFEEGYFDLEGDGDPLHHEFAREIITLPSRIAREHEEYLSLITLLCEISTSQSPEKFPASPIPVEDSDSVQEEIDIFLVRGDLIPPGVENDDSEDEDNSTFLPDHELPNLDHQDNQSAPRPPPEPPDVKIRLEPDTTVINNFYVLNKEACFNLEEGLIPNFLKTLVFGDLSRSTRASQPLLAVSLGKSNILKIIID